MNERELFIAGIGPMNGADLRALLQHYGDIKSTGISVNHETGQFRGFGFATAATVEDAQNIIKALNGTEYDGRRLFVTYKKLRTEGVS